MPDSPTHDAAVEAACRILLAAEWQKRFGEPMAEHHWGHTWGIYQVYSNSAWAWLFNATKAAIADYEAALWCDDMDQAPRDERLLLDRNGNIVCGRFNDDRYSTKPKPYWSHDQERVSGTVEARKCPPQRWRRLSISAARPTRGEGV